MEIARRTIGGLFWAYAAYGGEKLVSLLTMVVLARVLMPADFGVIAGALLFFGFLDALRDAGLKEAVTYASDESATAETGFTLNLGISVVQAVGLFALAPLTTHIIDDPRIVPILQVLSVVFIINALGATHDALLLRQLKFRLRYTTDLAAAAIRMATVLGCIAAGLGVWSMVAGFLAGAASRTIGRWIMLPWWPRPRFEAARARRLLGYGGHLALLSLAYPLLERTDQIAIATFIGDSALGVYFIALRLPDVALGTFNMVLTTVLFPVFVSMNANKSLLLRSFSTALGGVLMVVTPVAFGMAAVAPELVPLLFGGQWLAAVPVLQILAITYLVQTIPWTSGDVFKATGRPYLLTRLFLIEICYTTPAIWIVTYMTKDLRLTALTLLACATANMMLRVAVSSRVLGVGIRHYFRAVAGPLVAGSVMVLAIAAWRHAAPADLGPALVLSGSVALGAAVYLMILTLIERRRLGASWQFVRDEVVLRK